MRKIRVIQQTISPMICGRMVALVRQQICSDPNSQYADHEHRLNLSPGVNLVHFEDGFESQPLCHRAERVWPALHMLVGFTHTGIALRTNERTDIIRPNSYYTVSIMGGPLYRFIGTGPLEAEGTSFVSYHEKKYKALPGSVAETDQAAQSGFRTW
jgi:hypothetical protein